MEEKKRVRTDASRKADKKYNEKSITLTVSYRPTDIIEGIRVKQYLQDNNISVNSYIKQLIKNDLDTKGIDYPNDAE